MSTVVAFLNHYSIDKAVYYFELGHDNKDYIELSSSENDEMFILPYYTRQEINEDILYEIVQNNSFIYKTYNLENIKIKLIKTNMN